MQRGRCSTWHGSRGPAVSPAPGRGVVCALSPGAACLGRRAGAQGGGRSPGLWTDVRITSAATQSCAGRGRDADWGGAQPPLILENDVGPPPPHCSTAQLKHPGIVKVIEPLEETQAQVRACLPVPVRLAGGSCGVLCWLWRGCGTPPDLRCGALWWGVVGLPLAAQQVRAVLASGGCAAGAVQSRPTLPPRVPSIPPPSHTSLTPTAAALPAPTPHRS